MRTKLLLVILFSLALHLYVSALDFQDVQHTASTAEYEYNENGALTRDRNRDYISDGWYYRKFTLFYTLFKTNRFLKQKQPSFDAKPIGF